MKLVVPNVSSSLRLCLTALRLTSFWWPEKIEGNQKIMWSIFTIFSASYLVGVYIIVQVVELVYVLGDVSRMTNVGFLLFTNLALFLKIINVMGRRDQIHNMVNEMDKKLRNVEGPDGLAVVMSGDRLTARLLYVYMFLSFITVYGLAVSVQKPHLPLPARYPYDTTKSPAYELTYMHQLESFFRFNAYVSLRQNSTELKIREVTALNIAAMINISLDTLMTTLTAQCCSRFKILALALTNVCQDLKVTEKMMLSEDDEKIVLSRLRSCVDEHQAVLLQARQIQNNFSMPIFFQLTVSSFIICVTAYQLAFQEMKWLRLGSLVIYLAVMMLQVFMYCYHGNELTLLSQEIASAAFECPWYICSTPARRLVLMLMLRSVRVVTITVGGITVLSIATFMRIIKASYSFFTVLQSVQE